MTALGWLWGALWVLWGELHCFVSADLTSRPVYSHSSGFSYPDMVGGVNHSRGDYPYPTGHMRVPPRPQHRRSMGLYTPSPQYIPIPQGQFNFTFNNNVSLHFTSTITLQGCQASKIHTCINLNQIVLTRD